MKKLQFISVLVRLHRLGSKSKLKNMKTKQAALLKTGG